MQKIITDENFEQEVIKENKVVLLDFWVKGCGACRMLMPIMDKLDSDIGDSIIIGNIDVEKEVNLADFFMVSSLPAVFILKNGKVIDKAVGVKPRAFYKKMISKAREI